MNQSTLVGSKPSPQAETLSENRLLPLEGGNNFRDLGGYTTSDGKMVKRGKIFRSGVMTSLTDTDQQLLNNLGHWTIVDFRSREELEMFPNHWATNSRLNLVRHDYSMHEIFSLTYDESGKKKPVHTLYQIFPTMLTPQLKILFANLTEDSTPLVFNCSAGQDRTGLASALILHTLGVPWETIVEDYHLSTQYRRPDIEHAGINFEDHAETNIFAKLMLRYGDNGKKVKPLLTDENIPYLHFAFEKISEEHGSINSFVEEHLGIGKQGIEQMRAFYLD